MRRIGRGSQMGFWNGRPGLFSPLVSGELASTDHAHPFGRLMASSYTNRTQAPMLIPSNT